MKKLGSVAALFSTLLLSYGQGTVQFSTGPSTRVQYTGMNGIESVPPGFPVFYGLFVGHTADSLSLITPLAESSATVAGQIEVNGATAMLYVIPGFGAKLAGAVSRQRSQSMH